MPQTDVHLEVSKCAGHLLVSGLQAHASQGAALPAAVQQQVEHLVARFQALMSEATVLNELPAPGTSGYNHLVAAVAAVEALAALWPRPAVSHMVAALLALPGELLQPGSVLSGRLWSLLDTLLAPRGSQPVSLSVEAFRHLLTLAQRYQSAHLFSAIAQVLSSAVSSDAGLDHACGSAGSELSLSLLAVGGLSTVARQNLLMAVDDQVFSFLLGHSDEHNAASVACLIQGSDRHCHLFAQHVFSLASSRFRTK